MKVVYGHTDSIYCTVDSVEQAKNVLEELNEHVRSYFPNLLELNEHPVVIEFEKYFESLGVGATKNRNAGLITWKDGKFLDKKEFVMTGFTAKRLSETKLAKDTQLAVLNMWVENNTEQEIADFLRDRYNKYVLFWSAILNNSDPFFANIALLAVITCFLFFKEFLTKS